MNKRKKKFKNFFLYFILLILVFLACRNGKQREEAKEKQIKGEPSNVAFLKPKEYKYKQKKKLFTLVKPRVD